MSQKGGGHVAQGGRRVFCLNDGDGRDVGEFEVDVLEDGKTVRCPNCKRVIGELAADAKEAPRG
jgi:hypothetical protein